MEERKLSAAELRVMLAEQEAKEKVDRQAYKDIVDETIKKLIPDLIKLSDDLSKAKNKVYDAFDSILEMKSDLFGVNAEQKSHQFSDASGNVIRIGYRMNENYDDTVDVGVEKVKAYLSTLAKDAESASLVNTVMRLLSKDRQGNLRASRVIELEQIAIESKNSDFLEGIGIIKQAYKPKRSCRFVEASIRDEEGKEKSIPLSMSTVE
ncbi:MAG: DUF3164 family protein [Bacteroidales bacterium]